MWRAPAHGVLALAAVNRLWQIAERVVVHSRSRLRAEFGGAPSHACIFEAARKGLPAGLEPASPLKGDALSIRP